MAFFSLVDCVKSSKLMMLLLSLFSMCASSLDWFAFLTCSISFRENTFEVFHAIVHRAVACCCMHDGFLF
jgi:hypothetical protein